MTIRVHLADDHTMFREGLAAILSSRGGMEVVGRSSTGGEGAVALVGEHKPDVVVAEIDAELSRAKETLRRMRAASPDSKIVVLSMIETPRYLKALSKLGIDAYIHKSSSSEELIAALEAIGRGPGGTNVVSMPRGLLERLGEEEPAGALSERETEVVVLAARGLPNCRIAAELYLSEATVKRHLANVYQKIGVHSRSGAVRMALMEQWIGLHEVTSAESAGPRHPIHRSS
jgi:DNA-binding NarL/FixJ family response regulator